MKFGMTESQIATVFNCTRVETRLSKQEYEEKHSISATNLKSQRRHRSTTGTVLLMTCRHIPTSKNQEWLVEYKNKESQSCQS